MYMEYVYWGFFIFGIVVGLITVIFGDLFGGALEGVFDFLENIGSQPFYLFQPVSLFAGITVFGATGVIATKYSDLSPIAVFVLSLLMAILAMIIVYYVFVKPSHQAENSLAFSIRQLIGKQGVVSISIPANGYGEVMIKVGGGYSNQIAASFDKVDIKQEQQVFVVDEKEGVLFVSPLNI